jgi:hypothetical protein
LEKEQSLVGEIAYIWLLHAVVAIATWWKNLLRGIRVSGLHWWRLHGMDGVELHHTFSSK